MTDRNDRLAIQEALAEIAELRRALEQALWERDRYRKVVDAISPLDSIAVQRMVLELKRG